MVEARTTARAASVAAVALLLAACAGQPTAPQRDAGTIASRTPVTASGQPAHRVTQLALSLVGSPYVYGGQTPAGFDCSGLVYYTYSASGYAVPRTSLQQFRSARKISLADARPGDLVFFQDQAQLSHVGIFLGEDRFVHAPASGRTVTVASLSDPYYQMHLVGVGRLVDL